MRGEKNRKDFEQEKEAKIRKIELTEIVSATQRVLLVAKPYAIWLNILKSNILCY